MRAQNIVQTRAKSIFDRCDTVLVRWRLDSMLGLDIELGCADTDWRLRPKIKKCTDMVQCSIFPQTNRQQHYKTTTREVMGTIKQSKAFVQMHSFKRVHSNESIWMNYFKQINPFERIPLNDFFHNRTIEWFLFIQTHHYPKRWYSSYAESGHA